MNIYNTGMKGALTMYELYILETCPYSLKVMHYMDENNIPYTKKNIREGSNLDKLIELGGREQVPFLYDTDNNISMYESDEIINYVSKEK